MQPIAAIVRPGPVAMTDARDALTNAYARADQDRRAHATADATIDEAKIDVAAQLVARYSTMRGNALSLSV